MEGINASMASGVQPVDEEPSEACLDNHGCCDGLRMGRLRALENVDFLMPCPSHSSVKFPREKVKIWQACQGKTTLPAQDYMSEHELKFVRATEAVIKYMRAFTRCQLVFVADDVKKNKKRKKTTSKKIPSSILTFPLPLKLSLPTYLSKRKRIYIL